MNFRIVKLSFLGVFLFVSDCANLSPQDNNEAVSCKSPPHSKIHRRYNNHNITSELCVCCNSSELCRFTMDVYKNVDADELHKTCAKFKEQ